MFKKMLLFLLGLTVVALAADYSLTLNTHYLANPAAGTEINGSYDLPADTIKFAIEVKKNNGSWTEIAVSDIDTLNKTFTWRVPSDLTNDGIYNFSFRLYVNSEEKAGAALKIFIDKTKPKVLSVAYQPAFLSTGPGHMQITLTLTFDEPVLPGNGKIELTNPTHVESAEIGGFHYAGSDSSIVAASIKASDFIHPAYWTGNSTLTIKQFEDTLANVMDEDAAQPGPVVDLVAPHITAFSVNPDTMNCETEKATFTLQFDQALSDSVPGRLFLVNEHGGDSSNVFNPTFSNGNQTIECTLSQEQTENLQGENSFIVKELVDRHLNTIKDSLFQSVLNIDTKVPAAPTITSGNDNIITSDFSIVISGKKEKKAQIYEHGHRVPGNISGTSWSYEASIPVDSFYVFSFKQVDSVGNFSKQAVEFHVLADHSPPQLKFIPPRLIRTKKDSTTDSVCIQLDLYFDEQVVYQTQGLHLSDGSDILDLQVDFNSQGALQSTVICLANDVETIEEWIKQRRSITLSIDEGTFADLAGNTNSAVSNREVLVQNENYIASFQARKKYLKAGDTLTAEISFKPDYPPGDFIFQLSLHSEDGTSVFSKSKVIDLADNAMNMSFENNTVTRMDDHTLRWNFSSAELLPGKYIASVAAQDLIFEAVTVPVTMTFYVLTEAPQIVSIKPAGTPENHYISREPDFVAEFSSQHPDVAIQSAKLKFQKATDNMHSTAAEITVDMVETDAPFVWEYNCKEKGVKLAEGKQQITLTIENKAGMQQTATYVYNVTGNSVNGIKDFFNYPNPFNAFSSEKTRLTAMYSGSSKLELYIFDISGRLVHFDALKEGEPGFDSLRKEFLWDGAGLTGKIVANGVYFARLKAGSAQSDILKIVVNNH